MRMEEGSGVRARRKTRKPAGVGPGRKRAGLRPSAVSPGKVGNRSFTMATRSELAEMAATTQTNLENDLAYAGRAAGACVFVLFGAAGDLTKRKLAPALFNLGKAKLLSDNFAVLGVSVDDLSLEEFRSQVTSFLPVGTESDTLEWFRKRLFYERGDFADPDMFTKLRERLASLDGEQHTEGNYLFYLATAPKFFSQIVQQLGAAALSRQENGRWRRVVIEKPFGHDLESAQALNRDIKNVLLENH